MLDRITEGKCLFILGDEGIVYDHGRQEIYALNTAATYLWCLIEDGRDEAGAVADYAARFGLADPTARSHVVALADEFSRIGGAEGPDRDAQPDASVAAPDAPPLTEVPTPVERSFRVLETSFLFRCATRAQAERIEPVLARFAEDAGREPDVIVDLRQIDGALILYRSGQPVGIYDGLDALAPAVKTCLWTTAINNFDYFLNLHSGVVGHRDGCLLLPGASGNGKSSLTAALVGSGFPYLSDEVALLGDDCQVRSIPLSLCVKNTGWDIIARYFAEIEELPEHRREDGKVVKYLTFPFETCADPAKSYAVHTIVFPCYVPGSPNELVPVSKADALARLFQECQSIPAALTRTRVAALVAWIGGVDCFSLDFSDLDAAVAAVRTGLEK
ncbi:MAG: PqqD family peptide modification chaperone [Alphaproteobacteria bacterium]|nr:PqqD family peptide modification chaperone [Alphaproteobacteria bacterium]